MLISILNGNPIIGKLDGYVLTLETRLQEMGHQVTVLCLREKRIYYCKGCFDCWVKTPGECTGIDDSAQVNRSVIHSDLTILASPIFMGFISAILKKSIDKMIPLLHPYLVIDRGELHHKARYSNYPKLALLLEKTPGCDQDDIEIINRIISRTALNFKTKLVSTFQMDQSVEEVANEINYL